MQKKLFPKSTTARLLPLLGVLLTNAVTAAEPQTNQRPNFLFIYADDQRWDAIGVVQKEQGDKARFPWFQTPNLDRLASQGIRFRNAFCTNSLSAPSRACFLTGRYNHLNGVVNNHIPFPLDSVTYASLLKDAGYTTGYIGKWHMAMQKERPGFVYSASYIGQGTYTDAGFLVNEQPSDVKGYVDDVATDFAVDFLKNNKDKPFALVVGFKSPHVPFDPAPRNKTLFTGEVVKPAENQQPLPPYAIDRCRQRLSIDSPKLLNYFRCIAGADQNLGRLMDTLAELGLSKNTIVVYTSDNGFLMGEHGLSDKRAAYEESMRIPFIVKVPGVKGGNKTVDDIILNIDLAPTFLDYAGVAIPKEMQGRSMRPLLEGKQVADWRKSFFYEYFYEKNFETPTIAALRSPNGKLIQYPGHEEWTQIFDLAQDPIETKNAFLNPEYKATRAKLEAEMEAERQHVGYVVPAAADPVPEKLGGENDGKAKGAQKGGE